MKRKTPNINGFSISNLKQLEGEEGYVIRCNLLFDSIKLGEFFDKGDGSQYYFYPISPYTENAINEALKAFPPLDCIPELPSINWDIAILVDKLITQKYISKNLSKAIKDDNAIVIIQDIDKNKNYFLQTKINIDTDSLKKLIKTQMDKINTINYSYVSYKKIEELNEFYCDIMIEDLQ